MRPFLAQSRAVRGGCRRQLQLCQPLQQAILCSDRQQRQHPDYGMLPQRKPVHWLPTLNSGNDPPHGTLERHAEHRNDAASGHLGGNETGCDDAYPDAAAMQSIT